MGKKQMKTRNAKKTQFIAKSKEKPSRSPWIVVAAVVVAMITLGAGAFFVLNQFGTVATVSEGTSPEGRGASSESVENSSTGHATVSVTAATSGHAPYPGLIAIDGQVRLPLSTFDDGTARFYTYMNGDQPIEFFILKSSDGVVRAAFNACDSCYSSKRGYLQDGDDMVCQNCGLHFASDQINIVRGGCNPSPLDRVVDGDMLVIQEEDIIAGATYF